MLLSLAGQLEEQAGAVARLNVSMGRAHFTPQVTVVVGAGSDRSAENYARFFSRLQGGGVGDSAADAQAVANYLSIFSAAPSTLPGYGVDPNVLTPGHGYDPDSVAFYLSLFTLIRYSPPAATGLRI